MKAFIIPSFFWEMISFAFPLFKFTDFETIKFRFVGQ